MKPKKKKPLDFAYDDDYYDYMTKYLPGISKEDKNQHDFDRYKISKFLFHLFNKNQENRGRQKHAIRHTKLSDDNYALGALQDRNWPYFIDRIIEYSQGFLNLSDIDKSDITELNVLRNTRDNFEIVKGVYNELLNGVGIMLHQLFKHMGYLNKKKIDTDLTNHNFETFNPSDTHIHQKIIQIYKDFFYTTGRFPGNQRLISVPRGRIPDFIQSEDVISPRYLYERYLSRDMSGIVGVQFLAALNRYLGGEIEISRNAMSEFFHNLSWQALAADNDGILLQFEAIGILTHSINNLLHREMNNERADTIRSRINFTNILSENFTDETRTVQDTVEDNLVHDIINNDQTDYGPQYTFPRPKTEDEIEKARVDKNINFIEGELAKNARDFEIAADIEAQEKADLLRNILDPGFGLITNEDVSALDAIRNDNGDSAIPHLDPIALRGMEQLLDNLKETIDLSDDETEDVKPPPEAVYPPIADVKAPDLQDLLTDDNQNCGILDNIREIRDNVKTEVEDISSPPPPDDFPGDFDDTEFSYNYPPNPFRGATASRFPDEAPPYPGLPTAPPYPHNELPLPPNYDDLFGKPLPDPVPVNFIPLSDGESSDDDIHPPPPPNPRQIYTLVPPEVEVDSDGGRW